MLGQAIGYSDPRANEFDVSAAIHFRLSPLQRNSIVRALTGPMGVQIGHGNSAYVTKLISLNPEGIDLVAKRAKRGKEAELQREIHRLKALPALPVFSTILHSDLGAAVMISLYNFEEGVKHLSITSTAASSQ